MEYVLRGLTLRDASSIAEQINNIKIWNNLRDGLPYPYTEADAREFIYLAKEKDLLVDFAIVVSGKAVGVISLILGRDVERISAEIGYWLGEEYWGNGIMSRAVKEVVEYAFEKLSLHKVFATVFSFNVASMKVLEKAGFTKEAVLKSAFIKNGKIIDCHYYSIIKK
ncbi:GNAT family protein [uncultured Bacteroides sp.]|uniref:GNAT family N-acetyltransferase n=1 Tax=uncultured Bacteroides sp. TaxID=162156 RepID=UPI002AABA6FB|nr:GNAT family protein [uncultured Bacteroides sp.]